MEGQQLEILATSYATFNDYTNSRLAASPAENKKAKDPNTQQEIVYYQVPLMYNFGNNEKRMLNDFLFEGCEMYTNVGITSKPNSRGSADYSIMVKFDLTNENHQKFIEMMKQIHFGCAHILNACKGQVKLPLFNVNAAEATGLKSPIYIARDEVTGDIIQGRAPSMFFKLFSRGKAPYTEQTLFTDPSGNKIQWELLNMVEMKFIPLIHIKRIYIGNGKGTIQMEIVSAIVTDIKAKNTSTRQMTTINKLITSNPSISDLVGGQLAKLTLERQDQLNTQQPATNPCSTTINVNEATFSGINKPTMSDFTAMPQIRQANMELPTIAPIQLN